MAVTIKPTGVGLDCDILKFLDDLRETGPYKNLRLSRSALVNIVIEEWAQAQGYSIAPKNDDVEKSADEKDEYTKAATV